MRNCLERKRYLSGDEVTFQCELVVLEGQFGILKYVIDREWQVHGLKLGPGSVTYAFYWEDRPYNLYWWVDSNGKTVGHYFNLADSVRLSPDEFVWRDLVIDVLVTPCGQVQVTDEDEMPHGLGEELRARIEAGRCLVLQHYQTIIEEAASLLDSLASIKIRT